MAYVSYPQAIFMILQRIGQTPLQQVKSVLTGGSPTGAKAGLLATIIFVAAGAYQIPGVKEAIGNVGTWINEAIRNNTVGLDNLMGGALSNLSANPITTFQEVFDDGVSCKNLIINVESLPPPGLDLGAAWDNLKTKVSDLAGSLTSPNVNGSLLTDFKDHTDRLSGVVLADGANSSAVDINKVTNVLQGQTSTLDSVKNLYNSAAANLGYVGDQASAFVKSGLDSAHTNLLSLTDGKMGLYSDPTKLYGSLTGSEFSLAQEALAFTKATLADPNVTNAMIVTASTKLDEAVTALATQKATEEAEVNNYLTASTIIGNLGTQATAYEDPATKEFYAKIMPEDKQALFDQYNTAQATINDTLLGGTVDTTTIPQNDFVTTA